MKCDEDCRDKSVASTILWRRRLSRQCRCSFVSTRCVIRRASVNCCAAARRRRCWPVSTPTLPPRWPPIAPRCLTSISRRTRRLSRSSTPASSSRLRCVASSAATSKRCGAPSRRWLPRAIDRFRHVPEDLSPICLVYLCHQLFIIQRFV
jgi:hypothetical protein